MKKVIMNVKHSEKRIAVTENDQLVEWFSSADKNTYVGNIFVGQIQDVMPKLNAVFVNIGLNKNGFMRFEDTIEGKESDINSAELIRKKFHKGQYILVQVIKDAFDEKGPKLTNNLEFSGEYVVYFPLTKQVAVSNKIKKESKRNKLYSLGREHASQGEGVIFRSSCENADTDAIIKELNDFQTLYESLKTKSFKKITCIWEANSLFSKFFKLHPKNTISEIIIDDLATYKNYLPEDIQTTSYRANENIFVAYKIEEQIQKSFKQIVWLKNGSFLIFEQTEAMTVIDVNTGKFSGKNDREETVYQTNELAATEIVRQLRLRDIGGMIIIDFINMKSNEKEKNIFDLLKESFKNDRAYTKLFGFTDLGLFELTRKRTAHSHIEATHQKCPECNGSGLVKNTVQTVFELERSLWELSASSEIEAILIECSEDVAKALNGVQNNHIQRLEKALFLKIYIKMISSKSPFYDIVRVGTTKEISSYLETVNN
ncbi:Rne/Rng family ribonuclease [Bacillus sp. AFS041924]|uniref:Rne/Rng family ribonuclease n=1 Tax=Bacillus sp. AFS041924 TaxID=2033503 RepID=UPI00159BAA00|nr:Rne/Rng family ribonuclease [Bacillus sp. AFS041924]